MISEDFILGYGAGKAAGGGWSITDGIIVTERDSNGYATAAEIYASDGVVKPYQFAASGAIKTWLYLTAFTGKNTIIRVETAAFWGSQITSFDFSEVVKIGANAFESSKIAGTIELPKCTSIDNSNAFFGTPITGFSAPAVTNVANGLINGCTACTSASFPLAGVIGSGNSRCFLNCTALETVDIGSVGHGVTSWGSNNFGGCTQAGLTITVYTTGAKVDSLIADIRNGATNATIIIKASESTTYGGVSYAAGDTILTSTP